MTRPIYLDYMATTPEDPKVIDVMCECLGPQGVFGNPASKTHSYGEEANRRVIQARQQVAALINANPNEIIWTSGATEANNLAIQGAMRQYGRRGGHIITCQTEHKAVLDVCAKLASQGYAVSYLKPQPNGHVSLNQIEQAIRPDTVLLSLMHVNNEIGVVHDIPAIGELAKRHGVLFHVDAAQSLGKLAIDLNAWPVDLMSMSAHKLYGPKGIGALFVRQKPKVRLVPLTYGGGQELGLRSGTPPTHLIVGMGEACRVSAELMHDEYHRLLYYRHILEHGLRQLPGVHIHGDLQRRAPNNLNVSFEGVNGEALLYALTHIAVASGSACTSATLEPSHVLKALDVPHELADSAIRITVGRFTTEQAITEACDHIVNRVQWLRTIAGWSAK